MQNTCAFANESPREFELTKRNFISHFSIGSKGARDEAGSLSGETGNQYSSNMADDFAR